MNFLRDSLDKEDEGDFFIHDYKLYLSSMDKGVGHGCMCQVEFAIWMFLVCVYVNKLQKGFAH